jgi:uncharacterized OsmC-like protein
MTKLTTYYKGDMLFESEIGRHSLTIDVPAGMGGSDRGPLPSQLFVAALGGCIGAFAAQYCEQHGISDKGMRVELSYDQADDPTRLVNLRATVVLPSSNCRRHVKASEQMIKYCPVYQTIRTMNDLDIEFRGEGRCDLNPEPVAGAATGD